MPWVYSRWLVVGGVTADLAREVVRDLRPGNELELPGTIDGGSIIFWLPYRTPEYYEGIWGVPFPGPPDWLIGVAIFLADPADWGLAVPEDRASVVGVASYDPTTNLDALLAIRDRLVNQGSHSAYSVHHKLLGRDLLELEGFEIQSVQSATKYGERIDRFESTKKAAESIDTEREYTGAVAVARGGVVTLFSDDQIAFQDLGPSEVSSVLASVARNLWQVSDG